MGGVCPTTRWCCFCVVMSWGAYGCMKCIQDAFLAEKQGKIQLECVGVLPECDHKCPEVFPGVIPCFAQFIPPLL